MALVSCSAFSAPGDILFEEEFDNNGDYNSDWTDTGSGIATISGLAVSSSPNSLQIGNDTHTVTSRSGRIDTSGIDGADVSVWIQRGDDSFSEDPDPGEDLVFEYLNSGSTWVELATYDGGGTDGEILTPTFSLPSDGLHANLQLRFRFLTGSGATWDYWHIDDVVVTETGTLGLTCDSYADAFGSANYTNSDGTADWSGNAWSETNDDNSASSGLIEISSGQLELSGNNTLSNAAITRQADTSGATQLSLEFDFSMLGGIEAADSALLEISLNGGSSWTTLETFAGFSDGDTGSRNYDITAYASSTMHIRFAISPDDNSTTCCFGGGGERMEIDNLVIESCSIDIPIPIADYRLDESTWGGSANEVLDSSANGLHGRAINLGALPTTDDSTPAISGDPGTCGYGEFDGTSDGYLQIDDPGSGSIFDLDTNFSVAVWIYPTAFPSSGLATIVSKDENFEFHLNSSGQVFWWWGGGARQLTSSASVALNTWNHIAITFESGSQVIYINGVAQGTTNSAAAITLNNDPILIGTDLNFHSRRFTGLIDEVKIYDITLFPLQVDYVMNEAHPCAVNTVDHFSVQHSGTGITCESVDVTFVAHDAADSPVNVGGNTIDITPTSSTPGWNIADVDWTLFTDVNSGNGTFSTPLPGVARYTFATNETYVQFAFSNTSEADIDFDVVDVGDPTLTDVDGGVEDPLLSFNNAGLRFYNDADDDGNNDGTPIASPLTSGAVTTHPLIVRAVQTNTDTGLCEARVSGPQTVNMGYECVNPIACFRSADAEVDGADIGENDLGSNGNLRAINLTFDADGEAPFYLEYYDAGIIRLIGSLALAADGTDPAVTLTGTSDTTIVRPADLVVTAVRDSIGGANPATTTASPGFITSGSPFTVVVQARNADGGITPNFGAEIASEGITLVADSIVMPVGGNLAALTSPTTFSATATAGEFQNTALRWNEAGTLTVRAEGDGDYLGTGNIVGSESGNIGRFYPDHFDLTASNVDNGCAAGGFTNMSDQAFAYRPLDVSYSVSARSALSTPLSNYDDALGYPTRGFNAVAENNNNGTSLASRTSLLSGIWSNGVYTVGGGDNGGFARALSGLDEIVDGPYPNIQLGVTPNSSGPDTIAFLSADLTMHPTQANDCVADGDCNAAAIGTPFSAYFGRLYGRSAHGPETAALPVILQTEFWDGSEFVINATDSCTTISASDILFDGNDLTLNGNRTVTVGGGTSTGNFSMYNLGTSFDIQNGSAGLVFTSPGANNLGSFDVNINLANYPWLRNDWNNDDDFADDATLPVIEINFGRYRGHDRVIFWQEVLN
ncbi:MAG: LamG domain-containing protein [Agarilytica sp.]